MKILQITPYYLPHIGGIERYVSNLSLFLQKHGHTVKIITSDIPKRIQDEKLIKVLEYHSIAEPMGNPILINLHDLKKKISEYDIVHIHGIYTYLSFRTIIALDKNHNQKIVLTHHGRVSYPKSPKNIIAKLYEKTIVRYILHRVNHAVVLSQSDKEHLISCGMNHQNITILPNGIDTKIFIPQSKDTQNEFRKKYHLEQKQVVLYLAAVSRRKGILDLLQSWEHLEASNAHLLIVGTGPDFEEAEKLASQICLNTSVTFTGKISFSEILSAYSIASVYVLPSYFEGMPTTVLEALAMKIPVIATDIPGVADNFKEYCRLVPTGNIEQLCTAISDLLKNPLQIDLVENISRNIKEKYDVESLFKKYIEIYDNLK